jgi:hypothetical protein
MKNKMLKLLFHFHFHFQFNSIESPEIFERIELKEISLLLLLLTI